MKLPSPVLVFCALVLAGCGGGKGGSGTGTKTDLSTRLVGDWLRQSMRIEGESVECPGSIEHGGTRTLCRLDHYRFYDNGVFSDGLSSGSWKLEDDSLTLIVDGKSKQLPIRVDASGDQFEIDLDRTEPSPFRETAVYARYDQGNYEPPIKPRLWTLRAVSDGKEAKGCGSQPSAGELPCTNVRYLFNDDGTYEGGGSAGIYRIKGNTLTLESPQARKEYPFRFLNNHLSFALGRATGEDATTPEERIFSSEYLEQTELVFNPMFQVSGDFSVGETRQVPVGSDFIVDWHVLNHPVAYSRLANGNVVNLNGDGPGGLQTVIPTVPGFAYIFEMEMAANPDRGPGTSRVRVQVGDLDETLAASTNVTGSLEQAQWKHSGRWFRAVSSETKLTVTSQVTAGSDPAPLVRWLNVLGL